MKFLQFLIIVFCTTLQGKSEKTNFYQFGTKDEYVSIHYIDHTKENIGAGFPYNQ